MQQHTRQFVRLVLPTNRDELHLGLAPGSDPIMASPIASTSATKLPSWPPSFTSSQLSSLTAQATDYALSHGLVYRPIGNPPPSTHVHHAPISLLPSPFPRSAFQQALQIQGILNELYARVAVDDAFLERVIGKMVAPVDDFTRGLWEVYSKAKQQGVAPVSKLSPNSQRHRGRRSRG